MCTWIHWRAHALCSGDKRFQPEERKKLSKTPVQKRGLTAERVLLKVRIAKKNLRLFNCMHTYPVHYIRRTAVMFSRKLGLDSSLFKYKSFDLETSEITQSSLTLSQPLIRT